MIERLHPGPHPDADSLNAFIEGVLPEHERLQCLAHLAECDRCREVVFVAQEPPVPASPKPVPVPRRWFAPIPVLSAAAAACLVIAAVWMYLHRAPAMPPAHEMAAHATQPPPAPVSHPSIQQQAQAPPSFRVIEPHPAPRKELSPANILSRSVVKEQSTLPPPPSISFDVPGETARGVLRLPPAYVSPLPKAVPPPPQSHLSGITGTVTDPSGSVIPGATVKLHQLASASTTNAETDRSGTFKMTELPAGRYELQITANGFQRTSIQIDLSPQEVAVVTPTLSVGSSAQTVEVTAATPTLSTESASIVAEPRPLPSKLPIDTTIASGKFLLALDSDGTLFLSRNNGKSWKSVKPIWQGKVVELSQPDPPSTAAFQLTTDSGAHWLSRDGSHWYPTPVQH
jgi:Carboxypeptidase regulatory-like domain/Putative zinc-finger